MIVPLVFGHLAMMHVIQGVFDLTAAEQVIGTLAVNGTLLDNGVPTAVEFVYHRWSFVAGGVFVWRVYDLFLLVLVTIHGFNGLRYVLTDYTSNNEFARRTSVAFCTILGAILLVVGAAALFAPLEKDIVRDALDATAEIYELRGEEVPPALEAALSEGEEGAESDTGEEESADADAGSEEEATEEADE